MWDKTTARSFKSKQNMRLASVFSCSRHRKILLVKFPAGRIVSGLMKTSFLGVLVALLAFNSPAQLGGGGGAQSGMDAQFLKLFGSCTAFSAKCDVRIVDSAQKETAALTMDFAMLDGNVRNELDMTEMKSKQLPPEAAAQMKTMGMDKMISIIRKDTKTMLIIYPNMKSSAKMAIPKEQAAMMDKDIKMEKAALGRETVDGHPCVKNKITCTDDKGEKHESTSWNATDLKDFPVRIETKEKESTVTMNFKQIQLAKPDAKLFESPKGFTEYSSMQEMMMAAMQKMMAPPK